MRTERIMTVGNSGSGKTNYMETALLYISRYWNEKISLLDVNKKFNQSLNKTEKKLRTGAWLDKTPSNRELIFQSKEATLLSEKIYDLDVLKQHRQVIVDDWTGEVFQALKLGPEDVNNQGLNPQTIEAFRAAIGKTENFIIFIDGETLLDEQIIDDVQENFVEFKAELEKQENIRRRFVFAVTKTDLLDGIPQFVEDTGHLDLAKIKEIVRAHYLTFFQYIEWNQFPYEVFAVSCVPEKAHRKVDKKGGVIPNKQWTVEDMKDQLKPFEWMWQQFPISL